MNRREWWRRLGIQEDKYFTTLNTATRQYVIHLLWALDKSPEEALLATINPGIVAKAAPKINKSLRTSYILGRQRAATDTKQKIATIGNRDTTEIDQLQELSAGYTQKWEQRQIEASRRILATEQPKNETKNQLREELNKKSGVLMIAVSETNRAGNLGLCNGYRDAGIERVAWVAYAGCCDVCAGLDGMVSNINEIDPPPEHPSCRCTLESVGRVY